VQHISPPGLERLDLAILAKELLAKEISAAIYEDALLGPSAYEVPAPRELVKQPPLQALSACFPDGGNREGPGVEAFGQERPSGHMPVRQCQQGHGAGRREDKGPGKAPGGHDPEIGSE
jgi:hypothetical protein